MCDETVQQSSESPSAQMRQESYSSFALWSQAPSLRAWKQEAEPRVLTNQQRRINVGYIYLLYCLRDVVRRKRNAA